MTRARLPEISWLNQSRNIRPAEGKVRGRAGSLAGTFGIVPARFP